MSELLSLFTEDAKEIGWGDRRAVSDAEGKAKRATREPEQSDGEWIGPLVDSAATPAIFAGLLKGMAEGVRKKIYVAQ